MSDQEIRNEIHRALDTKLSGVQPDPFLEQRVKAQAARKVTHRRPFPLRAIAFALVLVLSTVCMAYATVNYWKLGDYFRWSGSQVPSDFDSGYNQDLTQELCGLRFHIRDAYMNGTTFVGLIEISHLDEQPALFLPYPSIFSPENLLGLLYKDCEGTITIGEYAKEKGLPIYYANSTFVPENGLDYGSGDMWMEKDRVMVYYTTTNGVYPTDGKLTLNWTVNVINDQGEWQTASKKITLPVEEIKTQTLHVDKSVPVDGIRVVMDSLTLRETRLDNQMDFIYHIEGEKPGDKEKVMDYRFRLVDPATWQFLPEGSLYSAMEALDTADGTTFIVRNQTVGLHAVSDALYFQLLPKDAQSGQKDAPTIVVKFE